MRMPLVNFTMSLAAAGGLIFLMQPAAAQAPKSEPAESSAPWTPVRLPDGQPDVRGYWVAKVYGMGCLSNPRSGPGCVDEDYGENNNRRRPSQKAASRVIDTPDGEVPYQPWARQMQQYFLANYFEPTRPEFLDR